MCLRQRDSGKGEIRLRVLHHVQISDLKRAGLSLPALDKWL